MNKQSGQIILMLILVMTVALAIGLSIVQKSLTDVSTSTKVEESQRAFSAAEAGIEKALGGDLSPVLFQETASQAQAQDMGLQPVIPSPNPEPPVYHRQDPLEYPPLSKEEVAHVWLSDLNSISNPPSTHYTQNSLDIFWGSQDPEDKTALELTLIYHDGSKYQSRKWYIDQTVRIPPNNFKLVSCAGGFKLSSSAYQCKVTIGASIGEQSDPVLPVGLMLLRARLLYNNTSQPFAVQAVGTCGPLCSIPPQARVLISTGTSGETQRKVKVFQLNKIVPPYFDYAIFSAGEIGK